MIRKKDLQEDIDRLWDANSSLKQSLTMPFGTFSKVTIKQAVCALLKFLDLEIAVVVPNERFEIKPIKQKKESEYVGNQKRKI